MIRTDLAAPDPDEDPVTYNTDAVEAQAHGPQTTPYGPRETHGAVAEHNGGSYHLKHMRSAPTPEQGGFTSGQGRLFPSAINRTDQPVDEYNEFYRVQQERGAAADAQVGQVPPYLSDSLAMQMRVQPPRHPVYFGRDRHESGAGEEPTNPAPGSTGRTIYGGPRTDQRY